MKRISKLSDLAFFGAPPAFAEPLHVGRPNIGSRSDFLRRVDSILDRRWFSNNGPVVREFEERIARYLDVGHCVAVCNGTAALEIAVRALELDGEVIVPSFTFVATAHALQWHGITPVFADIDPETCNLDVASVRRAITPRTSAILGVHVWGRPCAVTELGELAAARGLKLVFDAAHAFGCGYRGRMLGGFGACEVLSFHATKFLSTFEGGAVVTNDSALADRLRLLRNFGFRGADNVVQIGVNAKMPEICAAMGLTGLESIDEIIATNRRNHDAYARALSGIRGLKLLGYSDADRSNYQYVVVEVADDFGVERDVLARVLQAEHVLVRRYFYPGCHEMEPYRLLYPDAGQSLPHTTALCKRVLCFPTGSAVDARHIETIGTVLGWIGAHGREIARRMPAS
jgi:dTDP-4-amino-4,6-dideoxygalactose transaminase